MRSVRQIALVSCTILVITSVLWPQSIPESSQLDASLAAVLHKNHFTGRVQSSLQRRLGRSLNLELANLGRLLWFDTITGLNNDNTCGGCHSPTNGFGDTQSIAIGIQNNGVVGPDRRGPRNMRRTPTAANSAFFPNLMWNSRFASLSGNPFDNSSGLRFPQPEGLTLSYLPHLLVAQAFIPPTERTEVAGFEFSGDNEAIRAEVLRRLNSNSAYRTLFGQVFPEVHTGTPINFDMFGRAIAEFEFSLIFADAPLDRFARGDRNAMTAPQKRGALLFFGRAGCVSCHSVAGHPTKCSATLKTTSRARRKLCLVLRTTISMALKPTKTLALRKSPAIRQTVTNSAHRRCATCHCSPPSSITARSPAWKMRCGITLIPESRRSSILQPASISMRISSDPPAPSSLCCNALIRG